MTPAICENSKLSQLFLQTLLGKELFDIIPNGTICKIDAKNLGYIRENIILIPDSENKITVTIDSFVSYHNYNQYRVLINGKDKISGDLLNDSTYCSHGDLEIIEDF